MINRSKINTIAQIISGMEDAITKLEEAYSKKNVGDFEHAKKIILEFQERLSEELQGKRR